MIEKNLHQGLSFTPKLLRYLRYILKKEGTKTSVVSVGKNNKYKSSLLSVALHKICGSSLNSRFVHVSFEVSAIENCGSSKLFKNV